MSQGQPLDGFLILRQEGRGRSRWSFQICLLAVVRSAMFLLKPSLAPSPAIFQLQRDSRATSNAASLRQATAYRTSSCTGLCHDTSVDGARVCNNDYGGCPRPNQEA